MTKKLDLKGLLDFLSIEYSLTSGEEEIQTTCFVCGKPKHFYANIADRTFMCHHCGVAGGAQELEQVILRWVLVPADEVHAYWVARGFDSHFILAHRLGYYAPLERYAIPYLDGETITNINFRASREDQEPKYLRLPGKPGLPFVVGPKDAKTVVITEGEVDALSVAQALPDVLALGLPGGKVIGEPLLAAIPAGAAVVAIHDNDAVGKAAARKLRERIAGIRIGSPPGELKDVNDLLRQGGVESVRRLVDDILHQPRTPAPDLDAAGDRGLATPIRSSVYIALPDEHGDWLIQDLWLDRALGFVAGLPKVMKSLLTLHLAYHVAEGHAFLGKPILHPGPVILVQEEDADHVLKERLKTVGAASEKLWIWTPGVAGTHLRLDSDDSLEQLDEVCRSIEPVLVVLDPLANMHSLEDENNAAGMNKILERLRYLRDLRKCSVMVVHHLRKQIFGEGGSIGQRMRGSSVLHAKSESSLYVEKFGDLLHIHVENKMKPGRVLDVRFKNGSFVYEDESGAEVAA